MSISCIIKIESLDIYIYKHWDGNRTTMLEKLERFHEDFLENRGWDPHYELAQLLRHSTELWSSTINEAFTGWGLYDSKEEIDGDYVYILKENGNIAIK